MRFYCSSLLGVKVVCLGTAVDGRTSRAVEVHRGMVQAVGVFASSVACGECARRLRCLWLTSPYSVGERRRDACMMYEYDLVACFVCLCSERGLARERAMVVHLCMLPTR